MKLRKFACAVAVAMFALTGNVNAGPFEDAVAAHDRGDFSTAYRLFRSLAEQGDAKAQYNLAIMYDEGEGVALDDAEAVRWYTKAAEQGHAKAQYNLALMYENGEGVRHNVVAAHMWFSLALARGFDRAEPALERLAGRMWPAQIAEAERLARNWQPKGQ